MREDTLAVGEDAEEGTTKPEQSKYLCDVHNASVTSVIELSIWPKLVNETSNCIKNDVMNTHFFLKFL